MSVVAEAATDSTNEPTSGLASQTKQLIRDALSRMAATPGFRSRPTQRFMIAEVAKTLSGEYPGERVICVEGPTGTGKSLGYLLSAIPVAQAREKTLVIATATVALQEQLVTKDLPDLQARAELDFTFALAKGRRRYVCERNLQRLAGVDENQTGFDFGDGEPEAAAWPFKPEKGEPAEVGAMWQAREDKSWSGDLDDWSTTLRNELREAITTDSSGCTGKHCPNRANCSFLNARKAREAKDVIVANHALVMTDLMLGGGVVLPSPDKCIYVFDEGHHLPSVAVEQGAARTKLIGPQAWLADLKKLPGKIVIALAGQSEIAKSIETIDTNLADEIQPLMERLGELHRALQSVHPALADGKNTKGKAPQQADRRKAHRREESETWRFPLGDVPGELRALFDEARIVSAAVNGQTLKLCDQMKKGLENDPNNRPLGTVYSNARWIAARVDAMEIAFAQLAAAPGGEDAPPVARWIECIDAGTDFLCCASPTSAAKLLRGLLWRKCDGAVLTSATLTALGRFNRLFEQTGLGPAYATQAIRLASPFDYQNKAELIIPAVAVDPKDHDGHTAEIIKRCNEGLIDPNEGTLVLFASYRQMRSVLEGLTAELADKVLMQGSAPRHDLLRSHRSLIRAGKGSVLFGVSSFSEGVDLPGKECTHVIIAKLPFAVPNSPIEATLSEWLESRGRNPFIETSVPDASFKLIQSVGRLLRTEDDTGRVTVLDRRLADKPYGRQMMNALPAFQRKIERVVSSSA